MRTARVMGILGLSIVSALGCSLNRSGTSGDDAGLDGGSGGSVVPVDGGSGGFLGGGTGGIAFPAGSGGTAGRGSVGAAGGSAVATTGGMGGHEVGVAGFGGAGGTAGSDPGGGSGGSATGRSSVGGAAGESTVVTGGGGYGGRGDWSGRGGRATSSSGGAGGRGGTGGEGGRDACATYPGARAFAPSSDLKTHCYWPHDDKQAWSDAEATCLAEKGHLASVLSDRENTFVFGIANLSSASASSIWLGGTDDQTGWDMGGSNAFRWVTGEPFSYTNWAATQPDGRCDSCSGSGSCHCDHRIVMGPDGRWSDWWQDTKCGFVCEATP